MFNFLKRKTHEAAATDQSFRIVSVDNNVITFRSKAHYAVQTTVSLALKGKTRKGVREKKLEIFLHSANFVTADVFEYSGELRNPPTDLKDFLTEISRHGGGGSNVIFEQRRGVRAQRTFQVFSKQLQGFKALSSDISATGIRLVVTEELQVGSHLELMLNFDDYNFPSVKLVAEVVWCRARDTGSYFAGMRFVEMSDHDRQIAESYIDWAERYKARFRT